MNGAEVIKWLDSTLSMQAYDRGHSAGEAEVASILEGLKYDFKFMYDFLEGLE
jgi:hypothetical protein